MINSNINASSVNRVNAKVELYNGSTLVETCTCDDRLQDFTVERVGQNNKFFGFGVFHKVTINLIDLERNLTVTEANTFKIQIGYGDQFVQPYPTFYTNKVTRDETTNTITVVAYCKLATAASSHTVDEVEAPYTIREFASAATNILGVEAVEFQGISTAETCLDTYYENGGNFEGTESYQEALTQVAEVTQTIYFLNHEDKLIFKRLDRDGLPVLTISKNDYYDLESGDIRRLSTIVNTDELGDSTSATSRAVIGVTQYVRDNPFWELREDIQLLLAHAGAAIGGISAAPFHCTWDGNFLLEIGDKIALATEDNNTITSYLLNDTIRYDSTLEEVTQFIHDGAEETASNPLSLGERLKQTYAKVDKQNKQIELVASETAANKDSIASLTIAVDGVGLAIESLEDATIGDFTKLTERIVTLELSDTEIKASVSETKDSIEAIEGDVSDLSTELSEAVVTVGVLNGTVDGHTANIAALSGTVTSHTESIGTLTTTTEAISGRVSNVETKTTNLTDELGNTNAKVTANETAIGELNVTTESINASVSSLETVTGELATKDGELESSITTNSTAIGELQVTTESITASVSSLEETTDNLTDEVANNKTNISTLQITTEGISTSVSTLETNVNSQIEGLDDSFESLAKEVSTKVTAEDITVAIETERKNGATHVTTSTGFKFDSEGLTITKTDSEISTNIDEDGLSVFKHNEEVLTADNSGVQAKNLHATTYLIVGENTYFADYGNNRAGCFWTGK